MTSQVEVAEVAGYLTKWEDDKKAKYGSAYQGSHLSSMEFQAMNLKLPLIGLLVYCISLLAFTVDFLSEVTETSARHARQPPIHPNLISCSNPYQSFVLSRARRYSGTPTQRLAGDRKSSGKSRGLKILVSVVRFRPRAPLSRAISMT